MLIYYILVDIYTPNVPKIPKYKREFEDYINQFSYVLHHMYVDGN